ncbi:MAG: DUF2877 domain-containing protein [Butyricicoccus sp.]
MRCSITDASAYACGILQSHSAGTVHSVYRKTINLLFGGQLLALQAAHSPLSPLSLILDLTEQQMQAFPAAAGQSVSVSGGQLVILCGGSPMEISCLRPMLYDPVLRGTLPPSRRDTLLLAVQAVLNESGRSGFSLIVRRDPSVDGDLILSAAARYLRQAWTQYHAAQYEQSADSLCRVIGLGIGLTPSGDDFLCGIFAGLRLLGREQDAFSLALHRQAESCLDRTNEISAAFLSCALLGQFSQAVCSLPSVPSAEQLMQSFSAIGHSSGMDTLCGILFALSL